MQSNRGGLKLSVLGLVAILLLSLPLAAGAQTTGGTSGAAASTSSAGATNGITNPKDMAALSGTIEVRGAATSPSFLKWQLDLLPNGDPNAAIFLTLGTTEGPFTYSLDTTKLPAGEHALRLRVVRQDSNYDEYLTRFTIGNAGAGAAAGTSGAGTTGTGGTAAGAATTGGSAGTGTSGGTGTTGTTGRGGTAAAASTAGVTTNGLATPREGQAISGDFVVRGFASDPNFMKWQLDLLPNGNPNSAAFLALGETPGVFTYTLSTANLPAGQHALRLRVVRNDSNYTEYTTNFTIGGAGATAGGSGAAGGTTSGGTGTTSGTGSSGGTNAGSTGSGTGTTGGTGGSGGSTGGTAGQTANGITAPTEGATVRGSVPVRGFANAANFMKWQLDLLPSGNANAAVFLAVGEEPGEFTYTLDTTNLPAGEHALQLRVVRSDSNYDEYITRFTIAR